MVRIDKLYITHVGIELLGKQDTLTTVRMFYVYNNDILKIEKGLNPKVTPNFHGDIMFEDFPGRVKHVSDLIQNGWVPLGKYTWKQCPQSNDFTIHTPIGDYQSFSVIVQYEQLPDAKRDWILERAGKPAYIDENQFLVVDYKSTQYETTGICDAWAYNNNYLLLEDHRNVPLKGLVIINPHLHHADDALDIKIIIDRHQVISDAYSIEPIGETRYDFTKTANLEYITELHDAWDKELAIRRLRKTKVYVHFAEPIAIEKYFIFNYMRCFSKLNSKT